MTQSEQKLVEVGVSKESIESVKEVFVTQFEEVFNDYNISVSQEEILQTGVPVLFDIIYELGVSDKLEMDSQSYTEKLIDEFGTQSGRNNIHFISGRIVAEKPNTKLADCCKQLYGNIKSKEMDDNLF